jgi:hypothetical protein
VDLADLTFHETAFGNGFLRASNGSVGVGSGSSDVYTGVNTPASFGPGGFTFASSNSGGLLEIIGNGLDVPAGYVSGTMISGSSTYVGQTLASLGLTPGKYVDTWGEGADADSLTINIAGIPEPSTWGMMALGFAALGLMGWRGSPKAVAHAA